MTKQNRVDPWGRLNAVAAKGSWLGNRGILHNDRQEIVAPWRHKSWVTCRLDFRGVKREIFSPGSYSELFFLDEATALAAGHRPCAECRRQRYNEFKELWCTANLDGAQASKVPIAAIDERLHAERAASGGQKVTFQTELQAIPPGTMIELDGAAYLYWARRLHQWSPEGYSPSRIMTTPTMRVTVLTPASIVKVLRLGFVPQVHPSAFN